MAEHLPNNLHFEMVSCIMPTADRRRFIPASIRHFQAQTYLHKELVILDDGTPPVEDLIPDDPQIRYFYEAENLTLGAKRNRLCELAQGDIIAHWDDDDWYAPQRLELQVEALIRNRTELCGIERLFYYDILKNAAYEYQCKSSTRNWFSLLCYRRSLWLKIRFSNIQVGSDTRFLWHVDKNQMAVIENDGLNVCLIHKTNVSPKRTTGYHWRSIDVSIIRRILGDDWQYWDSHHAGIASASNTLKRKPRAIGWEVIIPTYNRPALLLSLLKDLMREADTGVPINVRIYDDASTQDYGIIRKLVQDRGWHFHSLDQHHGKHRYWQLIDQAFVQTRFCDPDAMFLFIHDDYRLEEDFFTKALRTWRAIKDPRKLTLTLSVDSARRAAPCWTGVDPTRSGQVWKIQWVDGNFIADQRFFRALSFRVPPVSADRWFKDPTLSSGVGRNLSVYLAGAGFNLYRTHRNIAHHQDGPSMLHCVDLVNSPSSEQNVFKTSTKIVRNNSHRYKWVVVIMTYERPLRLLDLLNDIQREQRLGHKVDVRVYNDASQKDYAAPIAHIQRNRWLYRCAGQNHGKHCYWRWINHVYAELKDIDQNTLVVFLQDDVRLCRDFFDKAENQWQSIRDSHKATLTLLVDSQREGRSCWTGFKPRRNNKVWQTQWVDQLFMADRRFLEAIHFRIESISSRRWQFNPDLSSGVGQQLSTQLHRAGWKMYCVNQSLIAHIDHPSLMNGELRKRESMKTVRFIDGAAALDKLVRPQTVIASLATIPQRQIQLQQVTRDLLPQVDLLRIYLNNYDKIPAFLSHTKIEVALGSQHGDLKDAGKFFWNGHKAGYHLSCDDDFFYPPNYVARLLGAVERYDKAAVVGFHGIVLKSIVRSYYRDRIVYHFSQSLETDRIVHIVGTGCAAWHSDRFEVGPEEIPQPNMTDIWLGRLCQQKKIPVVAVAHATGWLKAQPVSDSIFNRFADDDGLPTKLINSQEDWFLMPRITSGWRFPATA
ncbi:glycosyltransferase family 2 protein [uncultured Desulfobacter sp.]|uniref:glycosyltransferase family 2 protein n=1 Tax=uncultured Desulfobacter sp. TaxID=240139 RepID=UPI002AA824DA|nr:glycosyltransferase family 2 protein [uncultured Desulfobacter sp.]